MILGTGLHAPGRAIPNAEYDDRYGLDVDAFLRANRNVRERHLMAATEATSDLAMPAAIEAMQRAGIQPDALDLIVVATDTPDYISPATSSVVRHKLGASRAPRARLATRQRAPLCARWRAQWSWRASVTVLGAGACP
jgi:3-oxoacyl-[acyl-carrier-protein] synthase III